MRERYHMGLKASGWTAMSKAQSLVWRYPEEICDGLGARNKSAVQCGEGWLPQRPLVQESGKHVMHLAWEDWPLS